MKGLEGVRAGVIAGPLIGLTMSPITPTKASYLMGGEAGHNDPPSLHIHNQLTVAYTLYHFIPSPDTSPRSGSGGPWGSSWRTSRFMGVIGLKYFLKTTCTQAC